MSGDRLYPLTAEQRAAVDPAEQVWLRASAGTGKTQVLTARVIRLLLQDGVAPENLLCITFTKAGAAEMSERINSILARWVQLDGGDLFHDLEAIGANSGPEAREKARSLFAAVLDAPGGGLQIQTIHSLAQSLLGSFPEEAGLVPGFAPIEGRDQDELYSESLATLVREAEASGDNTVIGSLQEVSKALGEEGALKFLKKCAAQPEAMSRIPEGAGALIYARRLADVGFDEPTQQWLEKQLFDAVIDRQAIMALAAQNLSWNDKKGSRGWKRAQVVQDWLACDAAYRAQTFEKLHLCWTKTSGDPLTKSSGYTPLNESYSELALSLHNWSDALIAQVKLAQYADRLAPALLAGKAFSTAYTKAKRARGLVDFDDMIRKTAAMLQQPGISDWIRFKLDSRIDHILVDEAQDTNRGQWEIIEGLSSDFFSGAGAKGDAARTIFSVGDEKQAIFGFQGTDPAEYNDARRRYADKIEAAGQELQKPSLNRSYRSSTPVLDAVNAVFAKDPELLGEIDAFEPHESGLGEDARRETGTVELLKLVSSDLAAADDPENWVADEKRILASRIAQRVQQMVNAGAVLASTGKPIRAGDVMILLRSRGELASALVAQLHDRGVAVAGIDRLKMQEPLVVQDMLAAIRFVLQPRDEHSLACLLLSPLFGWSQDKLLKLGYREAGIDLWDHLRAQPDIAEEIAPLNGLLAMADFTTAYDFLENLLSGPMAGRRKLSARLGADALIPMEEMLNLAFHFEQQGGGTLQSFLHWFESDETEIKREMLPDSDEVRVMTVHGAKGLQSPVVIMADIASDPEKRPDHAVSVRLEGADLPLLNVRKAERKGRLETIVEQQKTRDAQEHRRLLYVAMTRAEEHLIMAGSLSDQKKATEDKAAKIPDASWHPHLQRAMAALGCEWEDDPLFDKVMRFHVDTPHAIAEAKEEAAATQEAMLRDDLPDWATTPAPPESLPPRPLVPSRIDDDDYGDAPAATGATAAAEKGRLLHMLFERIEPGDAPASLQRAEAWLKTQILPGGVSAADILSEAEQVVGNPEYADWFGPDSRAEVPLSAIIGETVVSGRADRLMVRGNVVKLLDFKTSRYVPRKAEDVQPAFLRQIAHYVAALEVIFPEKQVSAALLYSHAARLIALPPALLSDYKPKS